MQKKVDEEWKRQAQKEKETIAQKAAQENVLEAEPTFQEILSVFATQALLQLGELENPIAGGKSLDLMGAKHSIDILQLLKEKTKGNLTSEEERDLENLLYELRMKYVSKAGTFGG